MKEEFKKALEQWLEAHIASKDADGEWWGHDTNCGNITSDENLAPLLKFVVEK